MKLNHQEFIEKLKLGFPQLIEELDDDIWTGLLHLEMSVFARYTQKMVDEKNINELKRCLYFIQNIWDNCTEDVSNAIGVSYFENLDLETKNEWAYAMLTSAQKETYNTLHSKL